MQDGSTSDLRMGTVCSREVSFYGLNATSAYTQNSNWPEFSRGKALALLTWELFLGFDLSSSVYLSIRKMKIMKGFFSEHEALRWADQRGGVFKCMRRHLVFLHCQVSEQLSLKIYMTTVQASHKHYFHVKRYEHQSRIGKGHGSMSTQLLYTNKSYHSLCQLHYLCLPSEKETL